MQVMFLFHNREKVNRGSGVVHTLINTPPTVASHMTGKKHIQEAEKEMALQWGPPGKGGALCHRRALAAGW